MLPPAYVARRVGNDYQLVRIDLAKVVTQTCAAAIGLSLIRYSLPRNGLISVMSAICGAALAYQGMSGRDPIKALFGRNGATMRSTRSNKVSHKSL